MMLAPAERHEHLTGVNFVLRFSQNLSVALHDGVTAQDQALFNPSGNVSRFLIGKPGDQLSRAFTAVNSTFSLIRRRNNIELVTRLPKQFASTRRPAGKYEFCRWQYHNVSILVFL